MNKGVIYKIFYKDNKIKYCIRLDKTVKFGEEEYNIYIKEDKTAKLFNCNEEIDMELNISHLLGKKLNFTLIFKDDKDNTDKQDKITAIEETAIDEI